MPRKTKPGAPVQGIAAPNRRYAAQLRAGMANLRFAPDLEREYRASYVQLNAQRIQMGNGAGFAGVFAFIFFDLFVGLSLQPPLAIAILGLIMLPALAGPILVTLLDRQGEYQQRAIFASVMTICLAIVAVIHIGDAANPWFPTESMLLVTVYAYFLSGLWFFQALACGMSLLACYVATQAITGHFEAQEYYTAYYLFLCNVIGVFGLYIFESEQRRSFLLKQALREQAEHDPLTGLLNRRAFREHCQRIRRQARREKVRVGLILLDLDHFKQLNDHSGHIVGDHVLQSFAHILQQSMRRPLDAAARFGGDEFVAVWYDPTPDWFQENCRRIGANTQAYGEAHNLVPMTVSGGAVLVSRHTSSHPDFVMECADELLYEAKQSGRNSIVHARINRDGKLIKASGQDADQADADRSDPSDTNAS